jgi:lactoylglutathione lyase
VVENRAWKSKIHNVQDFSTGGKALRILHTMIRIGDLEKSKQFYSGILGMQLLREKEYPDGEFTLAFMGYGGENENTVLELTYNWGTKEYDHGNAFGHVAIEVGDVYQAVEQIRQQGGKVVREAGPMKHGDTVIAFVEDPDGYKIELIGSKN